MSEQHSKDWMTTTEAAAYLGVSEAMFRIIREKYTGPLATQKYGRSTLYWRSDVEQLARERAGKEADK
jgi:hypothetical protein